MANPNTAGAVAKPPAARFDFPGWVPPMLVKELRQGLRARGFVGGLILMQLVMLFVFIGGFTGGGGWEKASEGFFWAVVGGALLVAAPLRALGALGPEIELRTMDLLLLTRLDAWRIVWGKWVSLQAQTLLLLATLMPYAVVRYFFGSVDLVSDLGMLAAMTGGGAVLTGVALWASGLPKALRVLVIILGVFTVPQMLVARVFMAGMGGGGGGAAPTGWAVVVMATWTGAVVLAYALTLAVRWFAPSAENHSVLPRLVPAALGLPAPGWAALGEPALAAAQAGIALGALAFVAAVELVVTREPMAVHLRGWMAKGAAWRRTAGMLALPGWPSAAAWLTVMMGLTAAAWGLADAVAAEDMKAAEGVWLLALGWAALVFPAVLISWIPAARATTGVLYFTAQGVLGFAALIAGSSDLRTLAPPVMDAANWVAHALPGAGFWRALAELNKPGALPMVEVGQAAGLLATALLAAARGRPYWARVRWLRGAGEGRR